MSEASHRSILVVDIENSSALRDHVKPAVRMELRGLIEAALRAGDIDPAACDIEDRGDGVYLTVPGDVPKRRLVAGFLPAVDAALANRSVGAPPMRLRIAVAAGEVTFDRHGSSGRDVDRTFGMADHQRVRDLLSAEPRARMVIVVSEALYDSTVTAQDTLAPADFRRDRLDFKKGSARVWITVPGMEVQPRLPKSARRKDAEHGERQRKPSLPAFTQFNAARDVKHAGEGTFNDYGAS